MPGRRELAAHVAQSLEISEFAAEKAVIAVLAGITDLTAAGDMLILKGFGTFAMRQRRAHKTRNPRTGEPMSVPAVARLGFKQPPRKRTR